MPEEKQCGGKSYEGIFYPCVINTVLLLSRMFQTCWSVSQPPDLKKIPETGDNPNLFFFLISVYPQGNISSVTWGKMRGLR